LYPPTNNNGAGGLYFPD